MQSGQRAIGGCSALLTSSTRGLLPARMLSEQSCSKAGVPALRLGMGLGLALTACSWLGCSCTHHRWAWSQYHAHWQLQPTWDQAANECQARVTQDQPLWPSGSSWVAALFTSSKSGAGPVLIDSLVLCRAGGGRRPVREQAVAVHSPSRFLEHREGEEQSTVRYRGLRTPLKCYSALHRCYMWCHKMQHYTEVFASSRSISAALLPFCAHLSSPLQGCLYRYKYNVCPWPSYQYHICKIQIILPFFHWLSCYMECELFMTQIDSSCLSI